ncbi:MAG: group III truncated hemoglobin [Bacteroidota bacterium]
MQDIHQRADIELLVDRFYKKIKQDDLLGGIFHSVIQGDWAPHLNKMYRFWETVLLEARTYQGRPFAPHFHLPIEDLHFERWLALFEGTVDELFAGEKAEEAKWRANRMAAMFRSKLRYHRGRSTTPLI